VKQSSFLSDDSYRTRLLKQGFRTLVLIGMMVFGISETCQSISLKLKLEMLGYQEHEIAAILSGRARRADIDGDMRARMLCLAEKSPSSRAVSRDLAPYPRPAESPPDKGHRRGRTVAPPSKDNHPVASTRDPNARSVKGIERQIPLTVSRGDLKTCAPLLEKEQSYLPIIQRVAEKTHVEESLIMAVIKVESDFEPGAVSSKGAIGLMQLAPDTAASLGVADPFDPRENIHGGTRYLSYCIREFQSIEMALAAYNAGPGIVGQLKRVPPYPETRNFVRDVLYYRALYDRLLTLLL